MPVRGSAEPRTMIIATLVFVTIFAGAVVLGELFW